MTTPLPPDTKSVLTEKVGPLPAWAWGVVVLGAAYGYANYRKKKTGTASRTVTTPTQGYSSASLPSNIQPQYTYVQEGQYSNFGNTIGRQFQSGSTDFSTNNFPPGPSSTPAPQPPPPAPCDPTDPTSACYVPPDVNPPPPPSPSPQPPPAPSGQWLTVVPWNASQPNAPSTLTGLALQAYGDPNQWPKIWNAPQNAQLVQERGDPTLIQPGDQFFAPS